MADFSAEARANGGPGPGVPVQAPAPQQPRPQVRPPSPAQQQLVYTLDGWIKIVSARMLSLLAVIGAMAIFGYAIYDPQPVRAWTGVGYALTVLWPTIILYMRRD